MPAGKQQTTPRDFFVWPSFIFLILVPAGLTLVGMCGYCPGAIPSVLGPVSQFGKDYNLIMKIVFILAAAAHVVEAGFAFSIARKLNIQFTTSIKWFLVTIVMGIFSLGILRKQEKRTLKKGK